MQLRTFFLTVAILILPATTLAQYAPSKAQHEQLAKQKTKLMKIQVELDRLQSQIAFEAGELGRLCREVAAANRWPATVNCNLQNLTFSEPPPPPVSAQAPSGPSATQQSLAQAQKDAEQKKPHD